jgi:hypothetical protein
MPCAPGGPAGPFWPDAGIGIGWLAAAGADAGLVVRDVAPVEARVAAMRWAVLALPAEPVDADELDAGAGAALDWPAGAACSAEPPQASMDTATSDEMAASAAIRILDCEFITFLPSFLQANSRSLVP